MSQYQLLHTLEKKYIPLACAGKYTIAQAARKIGITERAVSYLKKRYRLRGADAFINAHTGKSYQHKKFGDLARTKICAIYRDHWNGTNFTYFAEVLREFYHIKICVKTLTKILNERGIISPKWHGPKKEKKKHLPRKEREHAGELLQLDASEHDWFMTGEKVTLHGAIDDATHKVTGLYFCKNECRLGYSEVLRQTFERYGASEAVYIDRHASFVKNGRKSGKTLEERLEYSREESTHWTTICEAAHMEIILALSPEAKGRIERLWSTLQGRLPYLLRFVGIRDMENANEFLAEFISAHNSRFSVPAQKNTLRYKKINMTPEELDYLLAVKTEKRTRYNGEFVFHGFTFRLDAPRAACRAFTLCLSELDGIRAYLDGKYYPVSLVDALTDCVGDTMPQVEKDLIARYLLQNERQKIYQFEEKPVLFRPPSSHSGRMKI